MLEEWSESGGDAMLMALLDAPTREPSKAPFEVRNCSKDHGTEVDWAAFAGGVPESNASSETVDPGADRPTERLRNVRRKLKRKEACSLYLISDLE